uniref:Uncharacterized protein n=1 Tax=Desmodus rotundus TaxID=9430 RepID=K9IY41_DESRO
MMCLGVGLFGFIMFGTLCTSRTCLFISFIKLGKFSVIIFSNRFPICCSFSSPSGTPMIEVAPEAHYTSLVWGAGVGFFFLLAVLIGFCFVLFCLLTYIPNHCSDSWLYALYW